MILIKGNPSYTNQVFELLQDCGIPAKAQFRLPFWSNLKQELSAVEGSIDANLLLPELTHFHSLLKDTEIRLVLAIEDNHDRKRVLEMVLNHIMEEVLTREISLSFPVLTHPLANVSKRLAKPIGEGTVIMPGATINSGASIGRHCIINTNASVDHDCVLEDFVHISPGVSLAGNVTVGEGTHVGIGASVIQGIKIGTHCTIGAGAVIIRDVPDGAKVVGNPGRVI